MSDSAEPQRPLADRALAWMQRVPRLVCDRIEPWDHGTVFRSTRFPRYFSANLVVVRGDPGWSVDELVGFADSALEGLAHRRIDFDDAAAAEPLRAEFAARGFHSTRLVWMHFDGAAPVEPDVPVVEVPFDAIEALRITWHQEDFPGDASEFHAEQREIHLALGTRVLAVHEDSRPVGFAALDIGDDEIEVGGVYVLPAYRGQGRGTALTQAAIRAAGDVGHLWICADDEDRPKRLYARLGFRPVVMTTEFWRAA